MKLDCVVVFLVSITLRSFSAEDFACSQCEKYRPCLSSLTQQDCPDGEYIVPHESNCKCCPGCKGGLTDDPCSGDDSCAPGLTCNRQFDCVLDKTTCAYTYHLTHLRGLPTCEVDGTFAAVQCKGDRATGRCFCYSENGIRIHGWAWWRKSKDMTCACSRRKYNLNKETNTFNTLHCDEMGNFEPLQCNDGICWCADPKTGEVIRGTRAVPQSMWTFLPCYDAAEMGLQYFRQCESAAYAQYLMKKALFIHGTAQAEFNNIHCDFDGAYGTYSILNGAAFCQWRDGTKLSPFQTPSHKASKMDCNCARDQKIFSEEGLNHRLSCGENGNYKSVQDINKKLYCVDRDGFAVSDPEETDEIPNCSNCLYYEVKSFLEKATPCYYIKQS